MRSDENNKLLPESPIEGLVPTMNNTGWMTVTLDEISTEFTVYAGSIDEESLDIGCAYGIATLAALERGARVCACDMDAKHLEILEQRVDQNMKDRLRCVRGSMPEIDFDENSFGAVLASRVLHFLNGDQVEQTLRKMHDWLMPGGRIFLVADSPYTGPWKILSDDYERRKAAGEPWPGFVADYAQFLPASQDPSKHPSFINPMDPDTLAQACTGAGFDVMEARWLASGTKHATGRDHAGVVAVRN